MTQIAVAMETWHYKKKQDVEDWLRQTCGPASRDTWRIVHEYGLTDLVMSTEVYTLFTLKWDTK